VLLEAAGLTVKIEISAASVRSLTSLEGMVLGVIQSSDGSATFHGLAQQVRSGEVGSRLLAMRWQWTCRGRDLSSIVKRKILLNNAAQRRNSSPGAIGSGKP
jgi:hypothetical protein